jgi:dTDP-4-dehydrorhamnose reductase
LFNIDLRDERQVKILFREYPPQMIFHFAALTSPRRNEDNVQLARESHINLTNNIVKNIPEDTHIIFLSTDKVFDGTDPYPDEETKPNPLWIYGRLKWECEGIIQKHLKRFHIFRLPIIHSIGYYSALSEEAGPTSFVDKAIMELKAGRQVEVFDNVQRCFLRLSELVEILKIAINDTHYGIYHVGTRMTNYYERIRILCEEQGIDWKGKLIPENGKALPLVQNLNTNKLKETFGFILT